MIHHSAALDHPILPEEEIRKLVRAHRKGDPDAASRILAHNERAIFRIARRYHSTGRCGDVPLDDLMQLGRMGMLRALEDFDLSSRNKFLTYAWAWVMMNISRHGEREGQQIKLSYRATGKRNKIAAARSRFVQEQNREPTVEELAGIVGIDKYQVMRLRSSIASLDVHIESKNQSFGELIPSPEVNIAEQVERKVMFEGIQSKMRCLSTREKNILTRFFGLDGMPAESLHTIASKIGISRARVGQIKDAALEKLREGL